MRLRITEGTHSLSCARCALVTRVTVHREGGAWQIQSGKP
jgi:hypothetical protein